MTNINEILKNNTNLTDALRDVRAEAIEAIEEVLRDMRTYDLVEILQELNDDFHAMDMLDDTFDYMSVTEILEELCEIDTSDDYFNADAKVSGNDPWSVSDIDSHELATKIYDEEIDFDPDDDIVDVLREASYMKDAIIKHFKMWDTARALFDQAMVQDPQSVISVLWNINQ